jgi:hypothetical protein
MTHDPRLAGFQLADGRRGGFCWDEKPFCVNLLGHRPHHLLTRDQVVLSDTIASCHHRPARGEAHCGVRLYIVQMTFGGSARVQGSGERGWLCVEITREHIERMKRQPMLILERLHLVGVALPGVDLYFPPAGE